MKIAIVGCGFVANNYIKTLPLHETLQLVGVHDRDGERARRLCNFYKQCDLRLFDSLDDILSDPSIGMVLNLTNPRSHYEVSRRCLESGKHVYSEKPLATTFEEAKALIALARRQGLGLASAPCSILGETAQTIWKALRSDTIGRVCLVYASLDCGPVHTAKPWRNNISPSGVPWPAKD